MQQYFDESIYETYLLLSKKEMVDASGGFLAKKIYLFCHNAACSNL